MSNILNELHEELEIAKLNNNEVAYSIIEEQIKDLED